MTLAEAQRQLEEMRVARQRDKEKLTELQAALDEAVRVAAQVVAPAPLPDQSAWLRERMQSALRRLRVGDVPRAIETLERALELPEALLPEVWEQRVSTSRDS